MQPVDPNDNGLILSLDPTVVLAALGLCVALACLLLALLFWPRSGVAPGPPWFDLVPRPPVFEVYEDHRGEWRWRLVSHGRIVADSGEGYASRSNAWRAVQAVQNRAADAGIINAR